MKKAMTAVLLPLGLCCSLSAEEAYLESDGTQYIVTGYYPTERMRLKADFQLVRMKASQTILGNKYPSGSGASFYIWLNSGSNIEGCFTKSDDSDAWSGRLRESMDTDRWTVEVDLAAGKFALLTPEGNPADKYSPRSLSDTPRAGTGTRPLSFFASTPAQANADTTGMAMKLYSAQIYEGEVLIHDYVPCKKGDRTGLYDRQTGEFWGAVTRQLSIGGDYLEIEDDPYIASPGNNVGSGTKARLDTLYHPNAATRIELDYAQAADWTLNDGDWCYMMSNTEAGNDGGLFGFYQNKTMLGVSMSMGKDESGNYPDQWKTFAKIGAPATYSKDVRRTAVLDNLNGKATLLTSGYETGSYENTIHWYQDRVHDRSLKIGSYAASAGGCAPMKIYGLKIFENNELLHDYVPMKSGSEGVLKDKVTGQILRAMDPKYPFAASDTLPTGPYVESPGNQCVELDYLTQPNTVLVVEYSDLVKENDKRVFGADQLHMKINGSGNQEYYGHSAWSGGFPGAPDGKHHRVVVDVPGSKIYYTDETYKGNGERSWSSKSGYVSVSKASTNPMWLFNSHVASNTPLSDGCKVRIYSACVYEDGELIHEYLPWVNEGLVGFKDLKTSNFFAGKLKNGKNSFAYGLTYGGTIEATGSTDAYIESDQTQYILTDYLPTTATRVEIDFQLTKLVNDLYVFGCNKEPNWELYVNSSWGWTTICGTDWKTQTTEEEWADLQRTRMVIDRKRGKWSIYRGDASRVDYKTYAAASSAAATVPFGIFARQESNGTHYPLPTTAVTGGMVPMRLYSFRAYEDDVLTLELLPYKDGETTGLKDTVSGKVYTSSEGNPFVVGGKGYDNGSRTFAKPLADAQVKYSKAQTLTVFAPGAIRYEWTRAGVALEETGDSISLAWAKVPGDRREEITVTPVYDVFGTEVKGEPSSATLENLPPGFVLRIR